MKYLLFAPIRTAAFVPHFISLVMDNAETYVKEGHSVDMLYCDGKAIDVCFYNPFGDKKVCASCNLLSSYMLKSMSPKVTRTSISKFYDGHKAYQDLKFSYNSIADIKSLIYKDVKIGYAALSTYLTSKRNLYPLISDEFRLYFDGLLLAACKLTDITLNAQKYYQPDTMGVFNSRLICCRPIVDVCKKLALDFVSFEAGFDLQNNMVKKFYYNATPHNVDYNTKEINAIWDDKRISEEKKVEIASSFFHKRRNAIAAGDKVYVKNQTTGKLPKEWDSEKHNIIIFNSSEDEFASLGEEFESMFFFESQLEGIKQIVTKYKDKKEYHFYVRVHPNLMHITYSYHYKLYDFDMYPNVTVIPAKSDISTYALIDHSDKVITFGSTTGAESVFSDKPTILLGCSLYRFLDICYLPDNEEELEKMILDKNLPLKDKKGALKFAYFFMNEEFEKFQYFTINKKKQLSFIKDFILTDCKLKSSNISRYVGFFLQMYGKYQWSKSNQDIPVEEVKNA